jgi:hypothetical protein
LQNKPNLLENENDASSLFTKNYRNIPAFRRVKNKPNSNPIQTQSKPILAQKLGGQTQSNPISIPMDAFIGYNHRSISRI